jgi:hypothetical protein
MLSNGLLNSTAYEVVDILIILFEFITIHIFYTKFQKETEFHR